MDDASIKEETLETWPEDKQAEYITNKDREKELNKEETKMAGKKVYYSHGYEDGADVMKKYAKEMVESDGSLDELTKVRFNTIIEEARKETMEEYERTKFDRG